MQDPFLPGHILYLYVNYTLRFHDLFGSVKNFFYMNYSHFRRMESSTDCNKSRASITMWTERTFNDFISFNIREPSSVSSQKFKFHIATLHILTAHIFSPISINLEKGFLNILREWVHLKMIKISKLFSFSNNINMHFELYKVISCLNAWGKYINI